MSTVPTLMPRDGLGRGRPLAFVGVLRVLEKSFLLFIVSHHFHPVLSAWQYDCSTANGLFRISAV